MAPPARRRGGDPVRIFPYRSFGTAERVYVNGRVMEDEGIRAATAGDSLWLNLVATVKRLESDEVPHARVRVTVAGGSAELAADSEGLYAGWVMPASPLPPDRLWHPATAELLAPAIADVPPAVGDVLVPPPTAGLLVISDIDDTIVRTDATSPLRMARNVFLGNVHTRLPFPGVAAFYRALQRGTAVAAQNPIFYVSSSPWNFYELLIEYLRLQRIPVGPLMLRDWGLRAQGGPPTAHGAHKLAGIQRILDTYATLPVILVGDSGQEDPEIYRDVVARYPKRILAAYIRDVTAADARRRGVAALAEEVAAAGSTLILADDTVAAARHAAEHGWIAADAVEAVVADKREDEAAPEKGA
ncbi:MAG TPA: phosphatase domain-containing protein [Gemmatimonadaceae bacterium]|nr:phosphatase domain-containing protein [Gemmatimonadaceae bacterium]